MKEINLREFYPWYMEDVMVEVTEEVAEELLVGQRYIKASRRRIYRNKAHYSLDEDHGRCEKANPAAAVSTGIKRTSRWTPRTVSNIPPASLTPLRKN